MEQVKLYKSYNGKVYHTEDECMLADKSYYINKLFIDSLDKDKIQEYFRKGSDEFWSYLYNNIHDSISKNIDVYIDKITPTPKIEPDKIKSKKNKVDDESE